jgi:hypothetical protein
MYKLLGKALAGVVLTKDARQAVKEAGGLSAIGAKTPSAPPAPASPEASPARATPPSQPAPAAASAAPALAALQGLKSGEVDPEARALLIATMLTEGKGRIQLERADLLKLAQKMRATKQTVLAELSDEHRAKLTDMASKMLSGAGKETDEKGSAATDRANLLRYAKRVRAAKQAILADLSPEHRAKLAALATKLFSSEGKEKKG